MNFYIIFLLTILIEYILLTLIIKNKEKKNEIFLILSFLQMFIILAIRNIDVGIDLQNYIPFYERCETYSWAQILEPGLKEYGYRIYNKILSLLAISDQLFFSLTAGISLIGVYFVIKKYSKNYFLSTYIYIAFDFYIFIFSGLRQSIALSIGMIAIKFIEEQKFFKFIILILLASTFHISALILIPMYFMKNIKVKPKMFPVILLIYFMLFIMRKYIISIILTFVYSNYSISNTGNGYAYLLLLMAIVTMITIYKRQYIKQEGLNNLFYNNLLVATLIQIFASAQGEVARLTMYYSIYMIIAIPNFIKSINEEEQRYAVEIMTVILLFIYFLISTTQNLNLYPIYSAFFK